MNPVVAFLGLGTMGGPMASNLARRGLAVRGWNRSPERPTVLAARDAGVVVAADIAEAVAGADIVAICVGDVADVDEVLFTDGGVAACAVSGTLVIDFSTIGPVAAHDFAVRLAVEGLRFLDAPVSGGDVGARAGTLTVMAGGDANDFAAAAPVFEAVGSVARHCGPTGSGQAVKLCNQVLAALHMVALTEAIVLARMQGIDPALMVDVCRSGAAGSWALANLGPRVIARDFAPGFMVKHLLKDLRLVLATAPGHGGPQAPSHRPGDGPSHELEELRGTILARNLLEKVAALGGGELGTQALTLAYEETKG